MKHNSRRRAVQTQSINSCLSNFILSQFPEDTVERCKGLECEGDVFVEHAYIGQDSGVENHQRRPYLGLIGYVCSIRGDFPHGVGRVDYKDRRPPVHYRYEFTNEELADLCNKGMFNKGFQCPDILFKNTLQLPMICNYNVVAGLSKGDAPVVFTDVQQQYNLVTSGELSGYSLTDYFERYDYAKDHEVEDERDWLVNDPQDEYISDGLDIDEFDANLGIDNENLDESMQQSDIESLTPEQIAVRPDFEKISQSVASRLDDGHFSENQNAVDEYDSMNDMKVRDEEVADELNKSDKRLDGIVRAGLADGDFSLDDFSGANIPDMSSVGTSGKVSDRNTFVDVDTVASDSLNHDYGE